jgi:hypothetical protein
MKYIANDLMDVAKHFDNLGKRSQSELEKLRKTVKRTTKRTTQLKAEMHAFFTCRDILKETELTKDIREE